MTTTQEKLTDRADLVAFGVLYWRDCMGRKDLEWALEILGEEFARVEAAGEPHEELRAYLAECGVCVPVHSVAVEISGYLKTAEGPKTEPEIDAAVEGKTEVKRKALRELVGQGKIGRDGSGKRGDPFRYSLVPSL